MSYDTTVMVCINHLGLSVADLGKVASDVYEEVKANLIALYYDGDSEDFVLRSAGDKYHEELNFLSHCIKHADHISREDDTSMLGWGYNHKNLNIIDFIEILAPFWKAYFRKDRTKDPIMVLYTGGDSDNPMQGYYVGVPPEASKDIDLVAYRKFDIQFCWNKYEMGFNSAKRI
jgi:hypothetical protein